jgi:hypothetical protein
MDIPSTGNVKISLDYGFASSGSITTKGVSSYLDFYNKYITSKVLTPRTYNLTFLGFSPLPNIAQGMQGKWGDKLFIPLPPGKYFVTGQSYPTKYDICGDTCYLSFHDTIYITQTTTNITLKAYYDCSLILLDTTDVKSTELFGNAPANSIKSTMMKGEFYHSFYANGPANGAGQDKFDLNLKVTSRQIETIPSYDYPYIPYTRNKAITMYLWYYTWEAGRYYYFSNTNNGYTLSPMGN